MPFEPTDIAIFLVSTAACLYCLVLSRRLRALQDTKNGLGATIVAFSESIGALSASTNETKLQVAQLAQKLPPLIADAQKACETIESSKLGLSEHSDAIIAEVKASTEELDRAMRKVLQESEARILELRQLNKELTVHASLRPKQVLHHRDPILEPMSGEHDLF
ncbi:MAG: hypothetical protein Hens3KO_21010 [Henriciella sp.]